MQYHDPLRRLDDWNEEDILNDPQLREVLKDFINEAGDAALEMGHIIRRYEEGKDRNVCQDELRNNGAYRRFKKLLNARLVAQNSSSKNRCALS